MMRRTAPDERLQSASEEPKPAPASNAPPTESIHIFSNGSTHPIKSEQHYMAPPQGMSVPGSFAAPQHHSAVQNPPIFQSIPTDGFMNPQGISHHGLRPFDNQPQCSITRLELTMNRVAESLETNNRLLRQLVAQGAQNTNALVNFNRENGIRLDGTNRLVRRVVGEIGAFREGTEADLPLFE
jgi:hypothetical protein